LNFQLMLPMAILLWHLIVGMPGHGVEWNEQNSKTVKLGQVMDDYLLCY
jgi:hypothetical protein